MGKRITTPIEKPGELIARWGRADWHSAPSIVYAYPDRDGKSDSRVLSEAIEGPRYFPSFEPYGSLKKEPSLAEDLASRGYDLPTLRISIRKRPTPPKGNSHE